MPTTPPRSPPPAQQQILKGGQLRSHSKANRRSSGSWTCLSCRTRVGEAVCPGCVFQHAGVARMSWHRCAAELEEARRKSKAALTAHEKELQLAAGLRALSVRNSALGDTILDLSQRISEKRISVMSGAFELSRREECVQEACKAVQTRLGQVQALQETLDGGLTWHLAESARVLSKLRWRKIVQLFVLIPIEVSLPAAPQQQKASKGGATTTSSRKSSTKESSKSSSSSSSSSSPSFSSSPSSSSASVTVTGISTIMGLPMPNNGDYAMVPVDVLMAALVLVAKLIKQVALYLQVALPHPISPSAAYTYATIAVNDDERGAAGVYPLAPLSKVTEAGVTGQLQKVNNTPDAFDTGLDLLRRDVVHLCVQGGVAVDKLWPAEALLLNLWQLFRHASEGLQEED